MKKFAILEKNYTAIATLNLDTERRMTLAAALTWCDDFIADHDYISMGNENMTYWNVPDPILSEIADFPLATQKIYLLALWAITAGEGYGGSLAVSRRVWRELAKTVAERSMPMADTFAWLMAQVAFIKAGER